MNIHFNFYNIYIRDPGKTEPVLFFLRVVWPSAFKGFYSAIYCYGRKKGAVKANDFRPTNGVKLTEVAIDLPVQVFLSYRDNS